MAAGGWAPIDPSGPDDDRRRAEQGGPLGGSAPPPPPAPPRARPRTGRRWIVGGATVAVLALLTGIAIVLTGNDPDEDDSASATTEPPSERDEAAAASTSTTTEPEEPDPEEAARDAERFTRVVFTQAGQRLRNEGSFAYSGYVEAATSLLRPATLPAGHLTVRGQVGFPRRSREVAVDESGRTFETVLVGPGVWERSAANVDALPTVAFELTNRAVRAELGPALVPEWLELAEDESRVGEIPGGGQRFTARVQYPDGPDDMTVTLDIDANEVPSHVRLESPSTGLVIDMAITDLGAPVEIRVPGGQPAGVLPALGVDEVVAAGIAAPVQLGEVPTGWILSGVSLLTDEPRAGCSSLRVDYWPLDGEPEDGEWLILEVRSQQCAPASPPGDEPFAAGAYTGEIGRLGANRSEGYVSDGTTSIGFDTSLTPEQLRRALETLQPYDPDVQPTPSDGLGNP